MTKQKPATPQSDTDVAIRSFINKLIENGRIGVLSAFARQLGYKTSHQIDRFLKGKVNYPKPRLDQTLEVLRDVYGANINFLITNKGEMFLKGAESKGFIPQINPRYDLGKKMTELDKLKNQMEEMKAAMEVLEQRIRDKDEVIAAQNKLIKRIEEK